MLLHWGLDILKISENSAIYDRDFFQSFILQITKKRILWLINFFFYFLETLFPCEFWKKKIKIAAYYDNYERVFG